MDPLPFAALRFEAVGHPWLWFVSIAAGAAYLVWAYRTVRDDADPRLGWWLLALRGAGVVALVAALAKPTWTREADLVDPGRLAVIVDNSASMSLADPSGPSRFAVARRAVERLRRAVATGAGPAVEVDVFDLSVAPLAADARPVVERTDLARAVKETVARLRSRPLAGVVLVSDGDDNTGRPDLRDAADTPVPVHTVGLHDPGQAAGLDLAVRAVRAPARAMVHNQIRAEVTVVKTGGPATRAEVVVTRGRESFARQAVDLPEGSAEETVTLNLTPGQPGSFVFTATVSGATGERVLANNSAHFPLRVDSEPIRVLYLEGFLRYESKFLKGRLEDDPDVSLVSVVRRDNPENPGPRPEGDLLAPDRLKNFDVVILGDMEAGFLNADEYRSLLAWLDGKGHALLVLGGYRSFGPEGFRTTPLAAALPVDFATGPPYQSEEPFGLELTETGRRHPVFEVTGDRLQDAAAWAAAPRLAGLSLVRGAKPGADVLAVNPSVSVAGKPAVVVAVQRYGAGHTMALAADTTWRWSRLTRVLGRPDTLYSRFWSQAVRWLAGRSLDDQRPPLALSTDRPDYDVGKPVTVRAVRQPRAGETRGTEEIALEVVGPTGRSVAVPVRSGSADPDVFTGTYYAPTGGRYELAAVLRSGGKTLANQSAEFLVHGADLELNDTGINRAALQSVATATGGQSVGVDDVESLAAKVPRKGRRTHRVRRAELWNSPALFCTFLAFVSAEWLLRRRHHLT